MDKIKECQVKTERIDDLILLLNVMKQIGLVEIINEHLPRHGNEKGLDWGRVAVIWLSYILSQGDHRKVKVREWVNQRKSSIEKVMGVELRETDLTDDRLGILLRKMSEELAWSGLESQLNERSIKLYELPVETVRIDGTTNSGYHQITKEGLFQFGKSKDNPNLGQIKTMMASLDPLGMPLVTHIKSGEKADDGLYVPIIEEINSTIKKEGLLYVGDCKMGAISTRGYIQEQNQYYLCPLAKVGNVPQELPKWVASAKSGELECVTVERENSVGKREEIGKGYELKKEQKTTVDEIYHVWTERILLVWSPAYYKTQSRGLSHRLQKAKEKIEALTPTVGRGKKQITEEVELGQKVSQILKHHQVEGLLDYNYDYQLPTRHRRGRYQITSVIPNQLAITAVEAELGWRAYVTNAPAERLSLSQAVLTYRDEWIIEHSFHRLKGVSLSLSPFFVQRDDQVQGLVHLLSLALRLLTLIEFRVRRFLMTSDDSLVGLYEGSPTKATQRPTAEKLLAAFKNMTLTLVQVKDDSYLDVTELNPLQKKILLCLGFSPCLYSDLGSNSS